MRMNELSQMTDAQARITEYWAGRAEAYHREHKIAERAKADRAAWTGIFKRYMPKGAVRVLDMGTGDGYIAHIIAELGHDVVGVDACGPMLDQARAEAKLRQEEGINTPLFAEADATDLPLLFCDFDVVVSRYLLWTLREAVAAIRGWAEALKPGGLVIGADATWFADGISKDTQVISENGPDSFVLTYTDELLEELPLATADSPEVYAEVFRAASLVDVEIVDLPEITKIDEEFGMPQGHESRPHFLVIGRKPA